MNELNYEVDKPFPDLTYTTQGTYLIFTNDGFDVLIIMYGINDEIISSFNQEKPRYVVMNFSNIPFLNLSFTKQLGIGCYLNVYCLPTEKTWLVSTSSNPVIRLFLVEERDFIIKSIQTISSDATFMEAVKEILKSQLEKYASFEQIDNHTIGKGLKDLSESMMKQWFVKGK